MYYVTLENNGNCRVIVSATISSATTLLGGQIKGGAGLTKEEVEPYSYSER